MRSKYENKVKAPIVIVNMMTMAMITFNLAFPLIDKVMVPKGIIHWVLGLLQFIILILVLVMCVSVNGGIANLFITVKQRFMPGSYLILRTFELLVIWVFYSFAAVTTYFWLLLVMDFVFFGLVMWNYIKYETVVEVTYVREDGR